MKATILRVALAALCVLLTQFSIAGELITYYHNDLQGSPIAATDSRGYVMWRSTYEPYGEKIQLPNDYLASADNKRGFTSHVQDVETGLVYMQARHYDPVIGRFLSVDPVGFKEDNLQTANHYAYGNNNPFKFVDPDGRETGSITVRSLNWMQGDFSWSSYCHCPKDDIALLGLGIIPLALFAPEVALAAALNPEATTLLTLEGAWIASGTPGANPSSLASGGAEARRLGLAFEAKVAKAWGASRVSQNISINGSTYDLLVAGDTRSILFEAKLGGRFLSEDTKVINDLKSVLGKKAADAKAAGYDFGIVTEQALPERWTDWLQSRGIGYINFKE